MKATLRIPATDRKVGYKELEVEISEEELKKLETKLANKTGYERVEDGDTFWCDMDGTVHPDQDLRGDSERDNAYDAANYYSDFDVAMNNARADKLMRKLRRFAVEHREKELDYIIKNHAPYTIFYVYKRNEIVACEYDTYRCFGEIMFDSKNSAELAIRTFKDELIWYFTEYQDSL